MLYVIVSFACECGRHRKLASQPGACSTKRAGTRRLLTHMSTMQCIMHMQIGVQAQRLRNKHVQGASGYFASTMACTCLRHVKTGTPVAAFGAHRAKREGVCHARAGGKVLRHRAANMRADYMILIHAAVSRLCPLLLTLSTTDRSALYRSGLVCIPCPTGAVMRDWRASTLCVLETVCYSQARCCTSAKACDHVSLKPLLSSTRSAFDPARRAQFAVKGHLSAANCQNAVSICSNPC